MQIPSDHGEDSFNVMGLGVWSFWLARDLQLQKSKHESDYLEVVQE